MKGRILTILPYLFLLTLTHLSAQNVTNINAVQKGKIVEITYNLDKAADISVYVSMSGGTSFRELQYVTGDVGKTVSPGHKTIEWDVLEEVDQLQGDNIVFMVRVDANAEKRWRKEARDLYLGNRPFSTFFTLNVAYSPMPQWSYGFKIGQVKKFGWYLNAMSNFHFKGMYHPFVESHYYMLTGKNSPACFSAEAGFIARPIRPLSLFVGAGYGYRTLAIKTSDKQWYSYPDRTYSGLSASAGIMFDMKGFVLTAEAATINFKTIEARLGLGFCIPNKKRDRNQIVIVK
mgnify:CR=1 FL=1